MKKLTVLFAGFLLASTAAAQDIADVAATDIQEPQRRYTVEVIIFSYTENVSVGTEIFLPDEPPVADLLLDEDGNPILPDEAQEEIPVYGDDVIVADEAVEEEVPPTWVVVPSLPPAVAATEDPIVVDDDEESNAFQLVLLTEDDFTLSDAADRFDLLDAYETLMHFGWTQPAFPEEETPAIELQLLAETPPGLNGTLTLYLSRYLHLVVDVAMDAPQEFNTEVVDDDAFISFGDARPRYEDDEPEPGIVRFRIQEDRILKNEELRYFDHPKFGVLAKVTRVEEPQVEEPEPLAARP
jgi:hypothetical protein